MAKTRNNHYVPIWYQKQFLFKKNDSIYYLNLTPDSKLLPDGRSKTFKALKSWPTSRCFCEKDLYTIFFDKSINDEIEIKLFGGLDTSGAAAVRAFIKDDVSEWHEHFTNFFSYIDAQKIRTPKGLDWLKNHYSNLNQVELMREMQAIRQMHCRLWAEGVREIVSAKHSKTKFILSDHPVTIYNYVFPPNSEQCLYPNDPSIALKGSQTIFPLGMDHCLILTNYEYADDPDGQKPTEKRTNARNFGNSLVRTNAVIRTRSLDEEDVGKINFIIKSRARRYLAAAKEEWLYPEHAVRSTWADLRRLLLPPKDELWHFGGELYVGYKDGSTYYQDAFGRTQPENKYLKKTQKMNSVKPNDSCGCGSGKKYKKCCKNKSFHERSSWEEWSVRERNIAFANGIRNVLGLSKGKTWEDVRRELNNEQVKTIHGIFGTLWPLETDLVSLLPKPDKSLRALYTGIVDPRVICSVVSLTPYFDEIIIQNPFMNPGCLKEEYSPTHSPHHYKLQTLKNVHLFLSLMPFVEAGYINLIPDICVFDPHLRQQMFSLAQERSRDCSIKSKDIDILKWLHKDDFKCDIWMCLKQEQLSKIKKVFPNLPEEQIQNILEAIEQKKIDDPFLLLQDVKLDKNGTQLLMYNITPNFEISLFIAQVTGSFLLTDNPYRWKEITNAQYRTGDLVHYDWSNLTNLINDRELILNFDANATFLLRKSGKLDPFRKSLRDVYVEIQKDNMPNEKVMGNLKSEYVNAHQIALKEIKSEYPNCFIGKISCLIPKGGIIHNNVQRMLVSCGIQNPLLSIPMAMLFEYKPAEL